jgi:hypothetical protein
MGKIQIKKKTADAQVTVKHSTGASVPQEEKVDIPEDIQVLESTSAQVLAEVGMSAGFTKNLGDFNSARIDVHLKMPCRVSDIDSAFVFVNEWVDSRIQKFQEEIGA